MNKLYNINNYIMYVNTRQAPRYMQAFEVFERAHKLDDFGFRARRRK